MSSNRRGSTQGQGLRLDKEEKKRILKASKSELTPDERRIRRRLIKAKKKKKRRIFLIIEILALLLLIALIYIYSKLGRIDFNDVGTITKNKLDAKTEQLLQGYTTLAFFGLDNRSNGDFNTGQSDAIMVAAIDNDTKEVKIVSVYRDTLLDINGEMNLQKANAAYARGGPKQAMAMLNRNLDLDVQDYIAVDFNALVEAVDAVGGINVDVTQEEVDIIKKKGYAGEVAYITGHTDENTPITPGTNVHLNGVQATAWCRIRYTSSMDFGRANRQRIVVEKLIEKAKAASPAQLDKLITNVFPDISTSLSATQLTQLALAMKEYTLKGQTGFPFALQTTTIGKKGSVDVPCTLQSNVKQMYEYLYNESDYTPTSTVEEISKKIQTLSGFDESDAVDYGYGTSLKEDQGSSVK
jgi:LCP family protein required for cell wall assembly